MPPVSEAQRRWAFANRDKKGAEGKAAREFADADPGGKLPARKPESLFNGGKIASTKGPKPPNADDGWITAQKGEYVIRKEAVERLGTKVLDQINRTGRIPPSGKNKPESLFNKGYDEGGFVRTLDRVRKISPDMDESMEVPDLPGSDRNMPGSSPIASQVQPTPRRYRES